MLLEGKKIFITGGYKGMGKATAKLALSQGALVTVMDFADEKLLAQEKEELGDNFYYIHGDATKQEDILAAVAYAVEKMGGITGAVNCAGGGLYGMLLDQSAKDFDFTMKLSLYSTFFSTQAEAREMKANGGSIVNISSMNSQFVEGHLLAYNTAKAGVDTLTKTAALELGRYNIRVNAIRPGFTQTDILKDMIAMPGFTEEVMKHTPLNRYCQAEDVANYAVFLLSDYSSFISGTALPVDGALQHGGYPDIKVFEDQLLAKAASK